MNASSAVLGDRFPQGQGAPGRRRNTPRDRLLLVQGAELGQQGWEGAELGDPCA